jgi:hypothetical protein
VVSITSHQYTCDKDILGIIHRNFISRINGDAGQEMLDLIVLRIPLWLYLLWLTFAAKSNMTKILQQDDRYILYKRSLNN